MFNVTKYVKRSKCEGTTLYRIAQWPSHHRPFAIASSHWRRKCENASGFLVTHTKTCTETCIIQYYLFIIFWIWLSVLILIDYWILSSTVLKIGLWYNLQGSFNKSIRKKMDNAFLYNNNNCFYICHQGQHRDCWPICV